MGCWADSKNRAFPEWLHRKMNAPDIIQKCMQLARAKGYDLFALQLIRQCFGGPSSTDYKKYGPSPKCKDEGVGGEWANQVYQIKGEALGGVLVISIK